MTARAVEVRPTPASIRVPAVASTAIHDVLTGPARTATVLGVSTHAIWFRAGDEVVVATTHDATRLPNGVEIGYDAVARIFAGIHHGATATIGLGHIAVSHLIIDNARWWDPLPRVPGVSPTELEVRIEGLEYSVPAVESSRMRAALAARSPAALIDAALHLLGKGPGLTPEGDDYLSGAISAIRVLGTAVGGESCLTMLDAAALPLSNLARERTTTFSAALIEHAIRGHVAQPAGALLRALAGRGDPGRSYADLMRVGHSSGPALAAGIVLAAQELIHSHATSERR